MHFRSFCPQKLSQKYTLGSILPEKVRMLCIRTFSVKCALRRVKLLAQGSDASHREVSAEAGGALTFTLCEAQNFTMAIAITSHPRSGYLANHFKGRYGIELHRPFWYS